MKGDVMEVDSKMKPNNAEYMNEKRAASLKKLYRRHVEISLTTLKRKVQRSRRRFRNKEKHDHALRLLTTDLNTMNLTKDTKNSVVDSSNIGSLLDHLTQNSPKNEAVWLDACRMACPGEAKQVIARGLNAMPDSVNLWMKAASLESGNVDKMRVLMKGIESIPSSIRLWKEVVVIANDNDAKFLLCRAVECCPLCVEFWLALTCLQELYDDAKVVIDKAKEKLPEDLTLVKVGRILEATKDRMAMIGKIIAAGAHTLRSREILDSDGAEIANEALVEGDGSDAITWGAIKVLMYNSCWSRKKCFSKVD